MKTCITCGMPLVGAHENDVGLETEEGPVCVYDIKDGKIKEPVDIFKGGVMFFMSTNADGDQALAERLTRKNMKSLAYWQKNPFAELEGVEATDDEFKAVMMKLSAEKE